MGRNGQYYTRDLAVALNRRQHIDIKPYRFKVLQGAWKQECNMHNEREGGRERVCERERENERYVREGGEK